MFFQSCFGGWREGGGPLKRHVPIQRDFCWEVQILKIGVGDHRKKNFFIISVELSMCDGLIETVKYIWVNILYMLDWILSRNCRNSLHFQKAGQLTRSAKSQTLLCPTELLAVNPNACSYKIEEYKNLSLVVTLHCLNSFQHSNYAAISLFICTAQGKPQNKCRLFSLIS